jgi:hypothetical protein
MECTQNILKSNSIPPQGDAKFQQIADYCVKRSHEVYLFKTTSCILDSKYRSNNKDVASELLEMEEEETAVTQWRD